MRGPLLDRCGNGLEPRRALLVVVGRCLIRAGRFLFLSSHVLVVSFLVMQTILHW
jgi:hypothetical protein